jgi:hypothetical protein
MMIKFGPRTYTITSTAWDSAEQMGKITYQDDLGQVFETESMGLAGYEQRQAVVSDIMRRIREARQ